jgi:hypothetical protein
MDNSKPVDHPDRETVAVRQGTGPRAMVSVLVKRHPELPPLRHEELPPPSGS